MLKLKPSCEHCDLNLPPESDQAMICSYECTFCRDCVEYVLQHVCPNCGGNFVPRPIRPSSERVEGTGLGFHSACPDKTLNPVNKLKHSVLIERYKKGNLQQGG
jgi:uncharacterized protein